MNFNFDINKTENKKIILEPKKDIEYFFYVIANNCEKNIDIKIIQEQCIKCKVIINCISYNNGNIKINLINNLCSLNDGNECSQSINGFILDQTSSINATPGIETRNNNKIKAQHQLNIGFLNEEKIFFLQTKGINKSDAIFLLIKEYFTNYENKKLQKIMQWIN